MENTNTAPQIVYGISQVPITDDVYDALKEFDTDSNKSIDLNDGNDVIGVENEYFSDDKKREYRLGIVVGTLVDKGFINDSQAKGAIKFFEVNNDVTIAYKTIYGPNGWKSKGDKKKSWLGRVSLGFEKDYWDSKVKPLLSKGVFHNWGQPLAAEVYDMFWLLSRGGNPPNSPTYWENGTASTSNVGSYNVCGLQYNIGEIPDTFTEGIASLVKMYKKVDGYFSDITLIECGGEECSSGDLGYGGALFFLQLKSGKSLSNITKCN